MMSLAGNIFGNGKAGLSINSHNPQVKKAALPSYAWDNDIAFYDGYYYFVETVKSINNVYRVPEDKTEREPVYFYEVSTNYGFNNRLAFQLRDKRLWFYYHLGGAVMGRDVYCRISDNGKASEEERGYLDFRETNQGTLRINQYVPPGGNNLWLAPNGLEAKEGKSIGKPGLIYGWYRVINGTTQGFNPDTSTTVMGNHVYVLASAYPGDNGSLNRIYRIDINTNETMELTDCGVRNFKIINNKLYYVKDSDGFLYNSRLDGTGEQKLSDKAVANYQGWYGDIDGQVYYTAARGEGLYNLYRVELGNEDRLVLQEPLERIQLFEDKIICRLAAGEDYGLKVLDKDGDLDLAITDQASDIFVFGNRILFKSVLDKSIKTVKLD